MPVLPPVLLFAAGAGGNCLPIAREIRVGFSGTSVQVSPQGRVVHQNHRARSGEGGYNRCFHVTDYCAT
jgi:hypothetical protein